jgi:cellulose synthase/poly-beta-1,6-N-acetylglucosamine synthase-like glycosyltransferase
LIPVVPEGTLLDDVFIPLSIQRSGHRVIFEPNARAWDDVAATAGHEFRRKVRTLAGNFQLLQLAPWALVNPFTSFRFISHKLMRLAVPWLLLAVLLISYLRFDNPLFRGLAIAQTAAYLMGAATLLWRPLQRVRLANAASAFIVLNSAAAVALFSFLRHKQAPTRIWNVQTKVDAAAQVPKSTQKAG